MNYSRRRNNLIITVLLAAIVCVLSSLSVFADAGNISESESGYMGRFMQSNGLAKATDPSKWTKQADGTWKNSSGDILVGVTGRGIDVSYAQGKIDWAKVKADGIDYAILRLCYGYHYGYDSTFEYNAKECERLGIPYGVYIYSYTESANETTLEANNVINLLQGYHPSYPVYFDLEDKIVLTAAGKQPSRNKWLCDQAVSFCEKVKAAGYTPAVYANLNWFTSYLTEASVDNYEKWVAQYNRVCEYKKPYAMWQNSSSGSVAGISGNVDMNFDFKDRTVKTIDFKRYAGTSRYKTATAIADGQLQKQGVSKFDNIVVASGENYPDALTGCYFAAKMNAPVLMVNKSNEAYVNTYIKNKLAQNGNIYILGGTKAVSLNFEVGLATYGKVTRLQGATRYDTNLSILETAEASKDLIVCTGGGYADSLSASSAGKPMMIVGKSLSSAQKNWLKKADYDNIYIIGGTGAIPFAVEKELYAYSKNEPVRLSGANRYETSWFVAGTFFENPTTVAFTCGDNFPDGIAGGPLAYSYGAPLVLVTKDNTSAAKGYVTSVKDGIDRVLIYGGEAVLPQKTVTSLFK